MNKRVIVTGSLAYDHIMSMPGRFSDHIMPDKLHILNISFIMQTFRKEFGGTAGNIAYSLNLLQTPAVLMAYGGCDFDKYFTHLNKLKYLKVNGIKISKTTPTAQGFVITDKNDNQIWGFYEGATKFSGKIKLKRTVKKDDFLVIAPNDPVANIRLAKEAVQLRIPYLFDPAFNIPHIGRADLGYAVKNATIVIGNDYEIELIKRRLNIRSLPRNNQIWITTLGSKGSIINRGPDKWIIPPAKPKNTSDPTGAGDAFRSGFLSGYIRDLPLDVCGRIGSVSAAYTVEKYGTQTHTFSIQEFKKRFKANYKNSLSI